MDIPSGSGGLCAQGGYYNPPTGATTGASYGGNAVAYR